MSERFIKGDRVKCIKEDSDNCVTTGNSYIVNDVDIDGDIYILDDDEDTTWVFARYFILDRKLIRLETINNILE